MDMSRIAVSIVTHHSEAVIDRCVAALDQAGPAAGQVFDPDFFLYKEDIELSLRLRKKGWRIVYHPGAISWSL